MPRENKPLCSECFRVMVCAQRTLIENSTRHSDGNTSGVRGDGVIRVQQGGDSERWGVFGLEQMNEEGILGR